MPTAGGEGLTWEEGAGELEDHCDNGLAAIDADDGDVELDEEDETAEVEEAMVADDGSSRLEVGDTNEMEVSQPGGQKLDIFNCLVFSPADDDLCDMAGVHALRNSAPKRPARRGACIELVHYMCVIV